MTLLDRDFSGLVLQIIEGYANKSFADAALVTFKYAESNLAEQVPIYRTLDGYYHWGQGDFYRLGITDRLNNPHMYPMGIVLRTPNDKVFMVEENGEPKQTNGVSIRMFVSPTPGELKMLSPELCFKCLNTDAYGNMLPINPMIECLGE